MKNYKQVKFSGNLSFQEFNSTLNETENIKIWVKKYMVFNLKVDR